MKGVRFLNGQSNSGPIFRVLLTAIFLVLGLLLLTLAAPTAQA